MENSTVRHVDHAALRTNQAFIISLLMLAYLFNAIWLVVFVGVVMIVGTVWPKAALFKRIYANILKPRGWAEPNIIEDNPEPHRFAQGFGGVVVAIAVLAMFAGASTLGWLLVWVVVGLAGANMQFGFCVGCFIYYQLNKLGVRGFDHAPLNA